MFTEKNKQQIKAHGLTETEVARQLEIFKNGIPFVTIVKAAELQNGINSYSETEQKKFVRLFETKKEQLDLLKFVPASGAATRMFKFLHRFLENYDPKIDIDSFLKKEENQDLDVFFSSFENFAFSHLVFERLETKFPDFSTLEKGKRLQLFVQEMLGTEGLDFSHTPKGLVPFHKTEKSYRTAFGEHLYEAVFYAASNGVANLHFTVSEEHIEKFKNRYAKIRQSIENKTGVTFNISYSFQKKKTDTIAATMDNKPFLDEKGDLLFRPAGHGALLDNLNGIDADIVFIKNIDNVVSEKYVETIVFQKKVLAGKLISLQQKIFGFVEKIHTGNASEKNLNEAAKFISEELQIKNKITTKDEILNILERPVRICGVVENTGAPGGGPFLIKDNNGKLSYQIVEMSQIDTANPQQKTLVDRATHFNPVDLVCGLRDYKGKKFNLHDFADPETGFISEKSYQGKPIKALERPGLWNGAMAHWTTVFVEVPLITFNPVKTVNDLLSKAHRS